MYITYSGVYPIKGLKGSFQVRSESFWELVELQNLYCVLVISISNPNQNYIAPYIYRSL